MNSYIKGLLWSTLIIAGAAGAATDDIAQTPLSVTQTVRPMVLLALSNDHQLYRKAYNDYSDLNGDGAIDTTYTNDYAYYGYFDPDKCYTYSTSNGYFNPTNSADNHQCNQSGQATGTWSGNLLNWAAMTRMDILRRVLYGGYRSTDTVSSDASLDRTVLERALLPTDAHAFAKVFAPSGSDDMAHYTPYSDTVITFCNVTYASGTVETQSLSTATYPPLIRVAKGSYPMWASGEVVECPWSGEYSNGTAPAKTTGNTDFNARVAVCVAGLIEDNCRGYEDDSKVTHNKPIGLLQKYGDNGSLRFGMMSGSYNKRKSGGVLRRKIGPIAGNATASLNEINLKTGQFTGNAGIISAINAFRINKYSFSTHNYQDGCTGPGILTFNNGSCTNWGNPIAEIYLEALRYFAGLGTPYSAYNTSDSSIFTALTQITSWGDPMPVTDWCAKCNVILIGTGVNSFDRDEALTVTDLSGLDLTAMTNRVGTTEAIGTNLILGGTGTTKQCTAKTTSGLAVAQGICPEGPTIDGGYYVAGAALYAHTTGLRRVKDQLQKINTQTVALARDLPRFNIAAGSNTMILMPHVEANTTGSAVQATTGWRMGNLLDLKVEKRVTNAAGGLVGGSLLVIMEDSTWGSDFDMDGAYRLHFCVGPSVCAAMCNTCKTVDCPANCDLDYDACIKAGTSSSTCSSRRTTCKSTSTCATTCASECNTTVGTDELRIFTSAQQAYAGHALLFGYTITGTSAGTNPSTSIPANSACDGAYHGDGVYREVVRVGGKNFSELTHLPDTANAPPTDCVRKFTAGTSTARLLEHPLWYAAKYGGFTDVNGTGTPDQPTEWDSNGDGSPDRFFYADNPALLGSALENFLEIIATTSSSASVVANSITLNENTRIFQGRYDSSDWSGDLVAFPVNTDGSLSTLIWSGRNQIDAQSARLHHADGRRIITSNEDRRTLTGGPGVPFRWGTALSGSSDSTRIADSQRLALRLKPSWLAATVGATDDATTGEARLNYLRGSDAAETSHDEGTLRTRTHVMGDVVNSDPVYVGAPQGTYVDDLQAKPYSTFASDKAGRQNVVYGGANDGMVHAFNADTGAELFAYVPRAVYPKLSAITALDYRDHHVSFVDAGPTAGDAYIPGSLSGSDDWRTVLVGGLGAGGRGVYALDVTDPPDSLTSESTLATRVLWDIVGGDTGFTDLGYTYSRPAIVRMPDTVYGGVWVVIFGNGYKSPNGKAVLYVVNAKTGALLSTLVVDAPAAKDNGLSSVAPVDYNGDGRVDYVYAGDLKGNLWRFEPTAASGMQTSFAGTPLFNDLTGLGGTTSPITVRPEVVRHPARGVVVLFGTGRYYREGDRIPNTAAINAFYGIWDKLDGTSGIGRAHLLKQQILAETTGGSFTVRVTSDNTISWHLGTGKPTGTPPTTHLGWYLELRKPLDGAAEGELQVTDPQLRGGRVIFTSLIPTDPATALCDFGGDGWLMELNALTGSRMSTVVYDLNADTVFNVADMVTIQVNGQAVIAGPSGKKSTVGIIQEPAIIGAGDKEYKFASGAREAAIEVTVENPGDLAGGRRSWLQLH